MVTRAKKIKNMTGKNKAKYPNHSHIPVGCLLMLSLFFLSVCDIRGNKMIPFPDKKYNIIVVDPPWQLKKIRIIQ